MSYIHSRKVFIETLLELAEKDPKIVLITMDVGFSFIERFRDAYPDRYFNFGVTEQSTMLIATALALDGWKPYVYSMINFVLFRPYEMVRNGVCLHNANVKLLGVKGSEKYKFLGFSHNMVSLDEDLKVLQGLPNLNIYVPNTEEGVKDAIVESYKTNTPSYIRL